MAIPGADCPAPYVSTVPDLVPIASSDAFVMCRLGFADVAVHTASLQEWPADPANPMEADAKP